MKVKAELMLSVWMGTQADEAFSSAWHSDSAAVGGDGIVHTRSEQYYSPKLWYLRVNVIEAQDLVLRDKNREIFVKATLGNLVFKTKTISPKNYDKHPTWNEDIMFVAAEPFDDALVLSVEDKLQPNREESVCLGRCVIPLLDVEKRLDNTPASNQFYNLERPGGGEDQNQVKFASKLNMRISLDGGYHVLDESTHYSSDLRPTEKLLWRPVIGVFHLGILNATGLPAMKPKENRTDAYCVAKYGSRWERTRTIVDSFTPQWNEQYSWDVHDLCTVLVIGVFDNGHVQVGDSPAQRVFLHQRIGKVRIRLSTLATNRIYTLSYPLLVLQPCGAMKMGEIQLAFRFSCSSYVNMLHSYSKPLLPNMHYLSPLSVFQIDSLRHQAAYLISSRLTRAEPPLMKEVVEYMLDVGLQMWSIRKGKANYDRVTDLLNGFVAVIKGFEQIRNWRNTGVTVMVHILFWLVVFFDELIFPIMFVLLFLAGIWRHRKRPRHPPHLDTKLSRADTTNEEELDEEFDTYPSKKTGEVVRRRYDRLRSIGGRMQTVLGDLATQGERAQSLLSWQDPRATAIIVCFSLIAAILTYIIPNRFMIFLAGIYVLRHPRFRIDLPSVPHNFFRRLPAKTDSMF